MDDWLDEKGLFRKNTALDGTCLFRAVAETIYPANPVSGHLMLRHKCVEFMAKHRDLFEDRVPGDYDEYLENLRTPKGWGTPLELDAISLLYKIDFEVYHGPENPLPVTGHGYSKVILLCVTGNTFYDAVYDKSHISNLGFTQSIVYNILYSKVFKLDHLEYAVDKMLHDKAARAQRERYLTNQSVSIDENELYLENPDSPVPVMDVVDSGAILFPYKVAKALDPDIYRNTDFDAWVEFNRVSRRHQYWYGNGGPLRIGVKCHVRLDDRIVTGHIQEMNQGHGPVVVFIEELSKKMSVSYENLIPLPRSSVRPDWSYSQKHQMINKLCRHDDNADHHRRRRSTQRKDEGTSTASLCGDMEKHSIKSEGSKDEFMVSEADSSTGAPKRSIIITPTEERALINLEVSPSMKDNGSDLPFDDVQTLKFFFNLGLDYFRMGTVSYGPPIKQLPIPSPDEYPSPVYMLGYPPYPPSMLLPDVAIPAGVHACQGVPLITALPSPPIAQPPCIPVAPPPDVCPSSVPPPAQPTRERSRNSKYAKPPRFQRLESGEGNGRRQAEDLQQTEVSSSSSPTVFHHPPPLLPVEYTPNSNDYVYAHDAPRKDDSEQPDCTSGLSVVPAGAFNLPPPTLMQVPYPCHIPYSPDVEMSGDLTMCEMAYGEAISFLPPEHLPPPHMYTEVPPDAAYPYHMSPCYQVYYQ